MFVGDAKYKKTLDSERVLSLSADLYQLLAYATALDLPGGLLIYAQGEAEAATYKIRNSCKQLEVVALDLTGSLEQGACGTRQLRERSQMQISSA